MIGLEKMKARSGEVSQSARALLREDMHRLHQHCMHSPNSMPEEIRWEVVRYTAYLFAWLMLLRIEEVVTLEFTSVEIIPGERRYHVIGSPLLCLGPVWGHGVISTATVPQGTRFVSIHANTPVPHDNKAWVKHATVKANIYASPKPRRLMTRTAALLTSPGSMDILDHVKRYFDLVYLIPVSVELY
ncbi:hypothetical protein M405DRAFT_34173 [Rhizopogon salebrosus TDB-379]|nr:hypothetical protein M405DRAFT_34173 [Rhizopogon salebrosus TDB-379]